MVTKNQQNDIFSFQENNNLPKDNDSPLDDCCLLKQHPTVNSSETTSISSIFSFTAVQQTLDSDELEFNDTTSAQVDLPLQTMEIEEHYCGTLEHECKFCGAVHFFGEANSVGLYKSCCHFGKVKLQKARKYPNVLRDLLSNKTNPLSKNFKANIRSYNSALSFASMGAQIERLSNGPYCFKIHGQVYHNTYNVNNMSGERRYSQLYVIDTEQATNIRLNNTANTSCNRQVMENLDVLIRGINSYSRAYKNMSELESDQRRRGMSIEDISMVFNRNISRDRRRYNNPSANEIAMIFTDPNGEPPFERDIRVYSKIQNFDNVELNILSPHLDPMSYVLFYPYGELGWQPNLILPSYNREVHRISLLQYKVAQIAIKEGVFNPILNGGKLFQQWIVDSYLQVEANNLNFIKQNQKKLRVDYYKGLVDFVNSGVSNTAKPVILPSTFQGSPRNMRERYHDAMAIVTKYGKPDLFVTMTCNPNWKEIKDNLLEGQSPSDRPDLVARVFNLKLKSMMEDIISGRVFGEVVAHVYSIEFQKRGLPHAHILIILKDKIDSVIKIDKYVSGEIPSVSSDKTLHENVMKHMIHGPCGLVKPNSPCMENGICTKEYPKMFIEQTYIHKDGYPLYKRTRGAVYTKNGHNVTNADVVPYNKFLLKKYNCHINVEVCTSIKSVKYIFKYIYKGYDCAEVRVTNNNEIDQYINSRYVSAPEAVWRLHEFKMHDKSHQVVRLPVHLPREQMIVFEEGREADAISTSDMQKTQLLAWFKLNEEDVDARELNYSEIPLHYIYKKGEWKKRTRKSGKIITRLYSVSPSEKERFFLRLLLLNVKGSTSFTSLRTYNEVVYDTFELAAEARGLLFNDNEWNRVLEEAANTQSPSNIRTLFAYICAFNRPREPSMLFEKFYDDMVEDFKDDVDCHDRVLSIIKEILNSHGWSLNSVGLPEPTRYISEVSESNVQVVNVNEQVNSLNEQQKEAFGTIISSIDQRGSLFFLDGPAGSGKTYLYNILTTYLKSIGKSTFQMATTGIAADLLENGRTVHSGMKLPVPLNEASVSRLQPNTPEAVRIMDASLILIDEVSMMSKFALDAIDEVLKRLLRSNDIFGGKTVLLGGDFRQTSNIVLKGTPIDIIENSLPSSRSWRNVRVLNLFANMRSSNQGVFANWLLDIGNGSLNDGEHQIKIPDSYLEKGDLVESIFGKELIDIKDESVFKKIILTTKNDHANIINGKVLGLINGPTKVYRSADTIVSDDPTEITRYPTEFLNRQQPSGLPPYELSLKIGSIIMLLRNLDARRGLLNGTRLWVKELHSNFIVGQIITGKAKGSIVSIPRIDMMPSDTVLPFVLKRRQFPFVLSFAMTIHKSQGQSFDKVGVYLPEPVFTHGQLYVALSRVRQGKNLKIKLSLESNGRTKNIVYDELIRGGIVYNNN